MAGPGRGRGGLTRRTFIKATAATAAGTAIGCGGDGGAVDDPDAALEQADAGGQTDAALPQPDARGGADAMVDAGGVLPDPTAGIPESMMFGLGVASGDVTSQGAILWARYDGNDTLALGVWEMDGDDYVRVVFDDVVEVAEGGFVHVDVGGLTPGARHRYAFFENSGTTATGRSAVGSFRAALADDALEPLVLAASSCSSNGRAMDTLARAGERDDIDVYLLLGDTVYADSAVNTDEYRAKWAENLSTDGYKAMRVSTSVLASWDDHEVTNDFDGESVDDLRMASATRAFFENLPLRRDEQVPDRIWKSIRWGLTAEIFVLDCRSERLPSTRGDTDVYLSPEQMAWLKQGLADSPATFKIIVNSVPISNFPTVFDFASADRWEGYPGQRDEIISFIDDTPITGVLWLAGDFHLASVGRLESSGPGSTQIEALCGPAAQSGNPLAVILGGDQFDWASMLSNYTTVELDPANVRATFTWIDGAGETLHQQSYDL